MSSPAGMPPGEEGESPLQVIGQLAGGIAHDFNNILGVIINYARFAQGSVPPGSPAAADIEEIRRAAERGVGLVRQLMILARRESGATVVFDLNELIAGLDGFLRSTIGEHITVERRLDPELWPLADDPARIEQILINLAVNARDAMPGGGTLAFETSNAELGSAETIAYPGAEPGRFVRLLVSDTGAGMDSEVAARAFEPMFTTKAAGQGTGLGLATVYTIVTQAGGMIDLSSQPGRGTSIEIHLPASHGPRTATTRPTQAAPAGRGESVLIAEDDEAVRRVAERILETAGYRISSCPGGVEALELLDDPGRRFDLLLADVVMPGMRGDDLARRAVAMRPGLHVLFMSGYSDDAPPADLGPTAGQVAFIGKPFDAGSLLERLRGLLGS
ncbi:MAG TPA: ATP-binding protein [Solirubrobacterales bacterium]|nr:ATP-binding protein [Solirubrobacterales bacterium]